MRAAARCDGLKALKLLLERGCRLDSLLDEDKSAQIQRFDLRGHSGPVAVFLANETALDLDRVARAKCTRLHVDVNNEPGNLIAQATCRGDGPSLRMVCCTLLSHADDSDSDPRVFCVCFSCFSGQTCSRKRSLQRLTAAWLHFRRGWFASASAWPAWTAVRQSTTLYVLPVLCW